MSFPPRRHWQHGHWATRTAAVGGGPLISNLIQFFSTEEFHFFFLRYNITKLLSVMIFPKSDSGCSGALGALLRPENIILDPLVPIHVFLLVQALTWCPRHWKVFLPLSLFQRNFRLPEQEKSAAHWQPALEGCESGRAPSWAWVQYLTSVTNCVTRAADCVHKERHRSVTRLDCNPTFEAPLELSRPRPHCLERTRSCHRF